MSTNYYLDSPDNEAGHLGHFAAGHFTAYAPPGIDTFEAWIAQAEGRTIWAESGYQVTLEEFLQTTRGWPRGAAGARSPRYDQGEFMERGVLFTRQDFC